MDIFEFEIGLTYQMRYIGDRELVTLWVCNKRTALYATFTNPKTGESIRRKINYDRQYNYEYVNLDTYSMAPVIRADKAVDLNPNEEEPEEQYDVNDYKLVMHSTKLNEYETYCEVHDNTIDKVRARAIHSSLSNDIEIISVTCYENENHCLGTLGEFLQSKINDGTMARYVLEKIVTTKYKLTPLF